MYGTMCLCFHRFSLLLLEPGEIYFQDFGATLYSLDCTEDEALRWYCVIHVLSYVLDWFLTHSVSQFLKVCFLAVDTLFVLQLSKGSTEDLFKVGCVRSQRCQISTS